MKVKVHEVVYLNENSVHPTEFSFDIEDSIAKDDKLLANEVAKLIVAETGESITECTVDVD